VTPDAPAELPLQTLTLPASEGVPGGPVAYADVGEGPTLVLVHGYPGRPDDFRWLVPGLRTRTVLIALPGFDLTPKETCPATSLRGRGQFIAAVLDALDLRGAIGGHSMGGGLAMAAAIARPERVERLALFAPLGLRPHRAFRRIFPRTSSWMAKTPWLAPVTHPLMRWGFPALGFPRGLSMEAMTHSIHCAAGVDFGEQREAAAALSMPTLLSWAEDDALIEPAIPRELAEALPAGPRLSWPTGGHGLVKTRAVELAEALNEFVGA